MERVSGDGFFSYRRDIQKKKDSRRTNRSASAPQFSEIFRNEDEASSIGEMAAVGEASDAEAAQLLDEVFAAGDRLKRSEDAATLRSYREAVQRFLRAVVGSSVDVEEKTSGSSIHRRKRYALLQIVNTKLEQLAAGMISSQRTGLDILARVDEINGMLVDLRH